MFITSLQQLLDATQGTFSVAVNPLSIVVVTPERDVYLFEKDEQDVRVICQKFFGLFNDPEIFDANPGFPHRTTEEFVGSLKKANGCHDMFVALCVVEGPLHLVMSVPVANIPEILGSRTVH